MSATVKVAIFGAAGYMGEELLRLLTRHPRVDVVAITSRKYAGQPVATVFPRFFDTGLEFCEPDVDAIAAAADVAFLALPHGLAHEYAAPLLAAGLKVIDLSADFRIKDTTVYEAYYKTPHPAPELLPRAVYGLVERRRDEIRAAQLIACPGCYPTSILLPTTPLLAAGLVAAEGIIAASLSGVSGAGRKVDLPYIFPECNESIRPYAVTGHRHTPEIEQELALAAGVPRVTLTFAPHLIPVNRGIHSSIFATAVGATDAAAIRACWQEAYAGERFVRILASGGLADTKNVTFTASIEMGCAVDPRNGRVILSSAIDNLCKGGSGQAVQCLNIMCGFDEAAGLV